MTLHQSIHDQIGPGTAVENITDNVQMIPGEGTDDLTDGLDHICGLTDLDDGVDEVLELVALGAVFVTHVDQLVDDLLIVLRHERAHSVSCVLNGDIPTNLHKLAQSYAVPAFQIGNLVGGKGQFGGGVVDEGGKVVLFGFRQGFTELLVQLVADFTGTGVENVLESLIFAMNVGHEVFCAFWQIQNGPQADDLSAGCLHSGVLLGKKLQIAELLGLIVDFQSTCLLRYNISKDIIS